MIKKILLFLVLLPIFIFGNPKNRNNPVKSSFITVNPLQQYPNYYQTVEARYLSGTNDWTYDGANGTISIDNNYLYVNFDPSWSYHQSVATGTIATLNIYPAIEHIELGPIYSGGWETGYYAKIENNDLIIYAVNPGSSPYFKSLYFGIGIDLNCAVNWYKDSDSDGYGDPNSIPIFDCYQPQYNYVANNIDCDDTNSAIGTQKWYLDSDYDGYGSTTYIESCTNPTLNNENYVLNNIDCDDSNHLIGQPYSWYLDVDNDGFGAGNVLIQCSDPSTLNVKYVTNNLDQCPTIAGTAVNNGCPVAISQYNYNHVITPKIPLTIVEFEAENYIPNSDVLEDVEYIDGFNKTLQTLSKRSNPDQKDQVTFHEYDEFGRETKQYFSFFANQDNLNYVNDAKNIQKTYYQNKFNDFTPFIETRYDGSPLNRAIEVSKGGDVWKIMSFNSGKTEKYEYSTNTSNEIRKYEIDAFEKIINNGFYTPGSLLKNIAKNENWISSDQDLNTVQIFTDKSGKKIAEISFIEKDATTEKLITQYIYNKKGLLSYIITPKAFNLFDISYIQNDTTSTAIVNPGSFLELKASNSITLSPGFNAKMGSVFSTHIENGLQNVLDILCYQYKYDEYNRKIEQKTPGKGWEYNVFDQLDRPILTQDEALKSQGIWLFTKYDASERVVYTGKYSSTLSRADLQAQVDAYINNNVSNLNNIEQRSTSIFLGGTTFEYSNSAFPNTNISEIQSITYYDDYNFIDVDKPITPTSINGQSVTNNTRGLITANLRKTIGDNTWTKTYTYYDEDARPIYSFEKNVLGGYTKIESTFDFRNKLISTVTRHKKDNNQTNDLVINDRYEYDYAERVTGIFQKVNDQNEETIVKNIYDEIGNLKQKKVGGLTTASTPLQLVTYTNNIRGWLTKINDPNDMGTSLFGLEIKYNNPTSTATPLFTGNISQVQWKTAIPGSGLKTYNYSFDKLNRLKQATFNDLNNSSNTNSFFEKINYDTNGNITSLDRSGDVLAQPGTLTMDKLTYNYEGNQVVKINETGDTHIGYSSYLTAGSNENTYEYDVNGNLIKDRNKGIDIIKYNSLNLVEEVSFTNGKKIKFKYDASGVKLSKEYIDGSNTTITNYLGGFQYLNGVLQFYPTDEGYAVNSNNTFKYVYLYSDQQGNNRLSYSDIDGSGTISTAEIQSVTDYYAYGMTHSGEISNSLASTYLYKLQGKEYNAEQNLNLYDFGSRMYDPAIGRWMTPDPQNQFSSPYLALGNNPVFLTDPDGEWIHLLVGGGVGLIFNVATNWNNIDNIGDFAYYALSGAGSGVYTAATGDFVGGSVMLGIGNNVYGQVKTNGYSFDDFDIGQTIQAGAVSGISAYMGGAIGDKLTGVYGNLFSKVGSNRLIQQYLTQTAASSTTGFTLGTGFSLLQGNTMEQSISQGINSAKSAFVSSQINFAVQTSKSYYENKQVQKQTAAQIEQTQLQKEFFELEAKYNQAALNKMPKEAALGGMSIADDAFVHVTTPAGAQNILSKGLNPEISGFVTKWEYVKNVSNPSEFNTKLYSQKLWPDTKGKFDKGYNILHINAKPIFFSPRTNWVNGVPQYKFNTIVPPSQITLIK
ncbi:RHS repeat domain-containing protein [Flavobacterium seoulense]|uniref:DUF6443 domain-containing protein n=1 Tax=Flavobacterium seoulense TaxID=1492738 RepID=A0A066WVK0_9FLAO|nr:DUF6443 domain-containing protein [Flavobacterium seoulense]KDN54695.1 hypothetical protein FEM21_22090 [Flavobacterium seoulense]